MLHSGVQGVQKGGTRTDEHHARSAFGNLRKELFENLGVNIARGILRRFGVENGYRDALSTRELFEWPNDQEWWLTCPVLQGHEGKGEAGREAARGR